MNNLMDIRDGKVLAARTMEARSTYLLTEIASVLCRIEGRLERIEKTYQDRLFGFENTPEPNAPHELTERSRACGVQRFIDIACTLRGDAFTSSADIWSAYQKWCPLHGLRPLSRQQLGKELKRIGFTNDKKTIDGKSLRIWLGIALR